MTWLLRSLLTVCSINLTVIEQRSGKGASSGKYEVIAGGRRYAALQRLAKEKKLPKPFPVPCMIVEASAAVETSLAENGVPAARLQKFTLSDPLNGSLG
jgi:ParB family transcriptional regulator, chromosome partitioning protein